MVSRNNPLNIGADIQAITFDAMGTLIVPHPSVGTIYSEVLRAFGYRMSPESIESNFSQAFTKFKTNHPDALLNRDGWRIIVANALQSTVSTKDFQEVFDTLWNEFAKPERWSILPGVEATLQTLQKINVRLFVLSNNDERLHTVFSGLSIGGFFEEIFASSELGAEKPSPRIFKIVQEKIGIAGEHILHVGDSPKEDIQGAQDAGWHAALVGPQAQPLESTDEFQQAAGIRELFSTNQHGWTICLSHNKQ
jgi:putative hydrolase of the HAD superfamily